MCVLRNITSPFVSHLQQNLNYFVMRIIAHIVCKILYNITADCSSEGVEIVLDDKVSVPDEL